MRYGLIGQALKQAYRPHHSVWITVRSRNAGGVPNSEFTHTGKGADVRGTFERVRLQQLLALGETRVHNMVILELDQQHRRAFVDWHHRRNEKLFVVGKVVLAFQMRMGKMPGKLHFRWTGPYWIIALENGTFTLGTLAGEILPQKVNRFRLKPYAGTTPPNPFKNTTDPTPPKAGPLRVESSSDDEPTT